MAYYKMYSSGYEKDKEKITCDNWIFEEIHFLLKYEKEKNVLSLRRKVSL